MAHHGAQVVLALEQVAGKLPAYDQAIEMPDLLAQRQVTGFAGKRRRQRLHIDLGRQARVGFGHDGIGQQYPWPRGRTVGRHHASTARAISAPMSRVLALPPRSGV
jgi:hypothetical protein